VRPLERPLRDAQRKRERPLSAFDTPWRSESRSVSLAALSEGRVGSEKSAAAAGIDPARLSGHSSRVGGAHDLVATDLGIAEVMKGERWFYSEAEAQAAGWRRSRQ